MKKHEKGELAKDILLCFLVVNVAVGLTLVFIALPGLAHMFKLFNAKSGIERGRVRQSVKRLQHRGYVRSYKKDGKEYIAITVSGKKEVALLKLFQERILKPHKWDGLWRMVMFDIPEHDRNIRDAFRHVLKKLELYQYQKSVFVYPYECRKEIDFVARYFNVRNKISYVVTQKIEAAAFLKKKFHLFS